MAKRKYTLEDIKKLLNELDIEWIDCLVYNDETRRYTKATFSHFKGLGANLYLKNKKCNRAFVARTTVTNTEFVVSCLQGEINASNCWQKYLQEKDINAVKDCQCSNQNG
jgi:hypothetical protein